MIIHLTISGLGKKAVKKLKKIHWFEASGHQRMVIWSGIVSGILYQVLLETLENSSPENLLPHDGLYRYLLPPGREFIKNQSKRAVDQIWRFTDQFNDTTCRMRKVINEVGSRVVNFWQDGPERAFVKEELMLILEVIENPPDYILEDYINKIKYCNKSMKFIKTTKDKNGDRGATVARTSGKQHCGWKRRIWWKSYMGRHTRN